MPMVLYEYKYTVITTYTVFYFVTGNLTRSTVNSLLEVQQRLESKCRNTMYKELIIDFWKF